MNDQRRVVITGTSRGLGKALQAEFERRGWQVFGCSRSQGVDVADQQSVETWAQTILSQTVPDLILNNAALINRNAPLWEVPPEEFESVIRINVLGTYHVARAFLPALIRRNSGVLVNFSSTWGRTTSPEVAPYCASKWAIEGLTRALAQELPAGVAAIALNPGIIDTDMLRSCFGASASGYPTPQEWARRAVPFLGNLGPNDNGRSLDLGPGVQ